MAKRRTLALLSLLALAALLSGGLRAQTTVSADRLVNAAKEPQNWLTYSGGYSSQRHSELKQITPQNAKDLTLKWVFQARSPAAGRRRRSWSMV